MIRDHTIFLRDILVAIEAITNFIGDMDFESFKDDDKTSSAVIRKLEIIGEVIKIYQTKSKRSIPMYLGRI